MNRALLVFSACVLVGGLSGCEALKRTQTSRADSGVYTRREWAARQQQTNGTPTGVGGASSHTPSTSGNPGGTGTHDSPATNRVPEATGSAARVSGKAQKVVKTAKSYLGTPYVYGGNSRKGLDCSALIQHAYASVGISLPRTSRDQGKVGTPVSRKRVQVGDLLFFYASTPGVVGHVGIVIEEKAGDLRFIHAALNGGVRTDWLSNRHWSAHYLYARRVL